MQSFGFVLDLNYWLHKLLGVAASKGSNSSHHYSITIRLCMICNFYTTRSLARDCLQIGSSAASSPDQVIHLRLTQLKVIVDDGQDDTSSVRFI